MNPFKKTSPSYQPTEMAETPYQKAKQEWDDRIGNARIQAANWRFAAILSLIVSLLLLVLLIISLSLGKDRLYIAQVTTEGHVVNVAPLTQQYQPTLAQKEYFLTQFVKLIRELPMDPIVARQHWTEAYQFLSQRASEQLNEILRKDDPLKKLGNQTIAVKINDINPMSDKTFQINWTETVTNNEGSIESAKAYSGVFTMMIKEPESQQQILSNPLGIYITDFHYSTRDNNA